MGTIINKTIIGYNHLQDQVYISKNAASQMGSLAIKLVYNNNDFAPYHINNKVQKEKYEQLKANAINSIQPNNYDNNEVADLKDQVLKIFSTYSTDKQINQELICINLANYGIEAYYQNQDLTQNFDFDNLFESVLSEFNSAGFKQFFAQYIIPDFIYHIEHHPNCHLIEFDDSIHCAGRIDVT